MSELARRGEAEEEKLRLTLASSDSHQRYEEVRCKSLKYCRRGRLVDLSSRKKEKTERSASVFDRKRLNDEPFPLIRIDCMHRGSILVSFQRVMILKQIKQKFLGQSSSRRRDEDGSESGGSTRLEESEKDLTHLSEGTCDQS